MPRTPTARAAALALLLMAPVAAFAQQSPSPPPAGSEGVQPPEEPPPVVFNVTVIGATPLAGVDIELARIPAPAQVLTDRDILESRALDLADFMNKRMNGVHVNEVQGNPFQPDVNYRGYTASPLLGTPQGLSVYMDGVRLNQPLGDVVSWDLIPRIAIASGTLMPGSNPLFGLNTLGGALSIQTKDGRNHRGTAAEVLYGSDQRRAVQFEHGGSRTPGLHWYLAGNYFAEDGWREDSPSDVRQLFGKLGWLHAAGDVSATIAVADNVLNGNGLQEEGFLNRDFAGVYTKPDITDTWSTFFNLAARHRVTRAITFSGNAYYRRIRSDTLNGDINEDSLGQAVYQPSATERAALAAAGYSGFPASGADAANTPFPFWRCLGNTLLNDEPAETCNGLINRSQTLQHNGGGAGQVTRRDARGAGANQLTVGAAYDRSTVGFQQSTELGYLNPDRGVTGVGAFGDGETGGDVDGEPYDTRVDLDGVLRTWSAYATDTLSLGTSWHLTFAGRYNRTSIENRDRIRQFSNGGGRGSLDGDHAFDRFNPAAGVTFSPSSTLNLYVGYSEGSRAPTSIELGCADPDEPCKLPNAMAGDPPLEQVVARTWESGLRGQAGGVNWSAGVFAARNADDILFVTSEQTGFGYFRNFGETRRHGLDVEASRRFGRITMGAGYTRLDATYQSEETVNGESNSTNDAAAPGLEGTIDIEPGDQIPLIPRHTLKAYVDIQATDALSIDIGVLAVSRSFARGNENNEHEPDGFYYLGPGEAPGYAVVDLGATYRLRSWISVVGQVNNLFDRRYYTSAQLGSMGFTDTGTFIAQPFPAVNGEYPIRQATFFAPGAPVRAWAGARFAF